MKRKTKKKSFYAPPHFVKAKKAREPLYWYVCNDCVLGNSADGKGVPSICSCPNPASGSDWRLVREVIPRKGKK